MKGFKKVYFEMFTRGQEVNMKIVYWLKFFVSYKTSTCTRKVVSLKGSHDPSYSGPLFT